MEYKVFYLVQIQRFVADCMNGIAKLSNTTIQPVNPVIQMALTSNDQVKLAEGRLNKTSMCREFCFMSCYIIASGLGLMLGGVLLALLIWLIFLPLLLYLVYRDSKRWSLYLTKSAIHYYNDEISIPLSYIHHIYAGRNKIFIEIEREKFAEIFYPDKGIPNGWYTYTTGCCCWLKRHNYQYILYDKIDHVQEPQEFVQAVLIQMQALGYQVLQAA